MFFDAREGPHCRKLVLMSNAYSGIDHSLRRIGTVLLDFAAMVGRRLYKMPRVLHSNSWTVSSAGTCM